MIKNNLVRQKSTFSPLMVKIKWQIFRRLVIKNKLKIKVNNKLRVLNIN